MATYTKRKSSTGEITWLARVRKKGQKAVTRTFRTKGAAEEWATAAEDAINRGALVVEQPGRGVLFGDLVDALVEARAAGRRPVGKTFANALARLKAAYGLTPSGNLTEQFWLDHAERRMRGDKGVGGSTVASELTYAGTVMRHAKRHKHAVDAEAPGKARSALREDGVEVISRKRTRRITDAELAALFAWIDANGTRTKLPLRDLVQFGLATAMRRGEILALRWDDIAGRTATIKRKHPRDRDRREQVPLLKPNAAWPRWDPLEIIARQKKAGPLVFPYQGDTLGFWFEKACGGAQLKNVVFHVLRHECLSRLAERGFDPLRLALIGGHRDMRNVQRYAKLDAERVANE